MPSNNVTMFEINGTALGSITMYFCDEGYRLIGSENITCENSGMWSGKASLCLSMDDK